MSDKINIFEGSASVLPSGTRNNNQASLYRLISQADMNIASEFKRRNDELILYTNLAENPKDVHEEAGRITLFSKLSYGLRIAGESYAWALVHKKLSTSTKKESEAVAAIDEFGEWMTERRREDKSFKPTADVRKNFVYLSESVKAANKYEAVSEGMAAHFWTIHNQLGQSISTLRAIIYGPKDSQKASWGAGTGSD